ncbi:MAG: anti-sigma factor family protein [Nitrososphaerales archaeon]
MLGNLSDYIDGELEAELCAEIEQHIACCNNCRVVVDTLKRTVTLYHEHGHEPLPEEVKNRLFEALNLNTAAGPA